MNGKVITKEQIEALPRCAMICAGLAVAMIEHESGKYISVDEITKLYDNAPSVGNSEPVCNLWVDPATLNYEVDRCTHPLNELIPVYTTPQPDRVAELEEALKNIGEWINTLPAGTKSATAKGVMIDCLLAQAMKG